MFTKNRHNTPQTDTLIYADPPSLHKPDPAKRRRRAVAILAVVSLAACLTTAAALGRSILNREARYVQAQMWLEQEAYADALAAFESLGDYRDSQQQFSRLAALEAAYGEAVALMERAEAGLARTDPAADFRTAAEQLEALGDYADAPELAAACREAAEALME